jgi:hypothetical protein
MLKENLNAHRIKAEWLDRVYDLQIIFNKQTDGGSKQRSLEYAMDYFELEQTLPAHDALNDAYFTALVAQKLDVIKGVAEYDAQRGENLSEAIIGDADAGDDGYVTIGELLEDEVVCSPVCPICKKPLEQKGRALHSKGQRYTFYFTCKKDGDLFEILRLHKNFNETWRARVVFTRANPEKLAEYTSALERGENRRKTTTRRRRPRRHRSNKPATPQGE